MSSLPTPPSGPLESSPDSPAGRSSRIGDPLVSADRLGVRFDGSRRGQPPTDALDGVDLTVGRGEFVAVVGPSGCGKTTLLRVIAGLTAPTSGEIRTATDDIGYVFQDATLLPWRDVQRNVELSGELAHLSAEERRSRATAAIARVGLSEFSRAWPRTLSGGMRMRVALARALMLRPELYCFDEPFGSLDELTRNRMGEELHELFVSMRFGAIFVTHSVTEAVYLADRVLVMSPRPGRIVEEVRVDLPVPRPPEIRYDPALARLAAKVSAVLLSSAEDSAGREVR